MTEGRTRSYTDADGFPSIKQETSDHKLPIFVKQQLSLRRGTLHVCQFIFSYYLWVVVSIV